jgi:hypothetical protein
MAIACAPALEASSVVENEGEIHEEWEVFVLLDGDFRALCLMN